MSTFYRFPHTPHIAWLGDGSPRDDKVLSSPEVSDLLAGEVTVEEKIDGANVGLSLNAQGQVQAQNRGQYLESPFVGQFTRLPGWLAQHEQPLRSVLTSDLILFGEWCTARHSLAYDALPDWFLLFDVYDRGNRQFWNTSRRDGLADAAGLNVVPEILRGRFTLQALKQIVKTHDSAYRDGPLEGIVVRRDGREWCEARGKLVHPDFTQAIDGHWRSRAIEWNRLQ